MHPPWFRHFREIVVCDTEYYCPDGELPSVHCVVATEVKSGRTVSIGRSELRSMSDPPFATDASTLFVAYADLNDPQLLVTVVLDEAESGADDAGPIARQVLERTILAGWLN